MAWLSNWKWRRKITISNTNLDAILSDFPILIKISANSGTGSTDITDIFTELGADANRKKIAVTTSDGEIQCYVEIERWDHSNNEAWLWIKVPSVSSDSETVLYLYYDSTQSDNISYIGDTTETPAQNVWDSNFKLVMHMAQDPSGGSNAIKDSTSNANHGTPAGVMTSADLVDGKIGKAIEFDGNDDHIQLATKIGIGAKTLEVVFYATDATHTQLTDVFLGETGGSSDSYGNWFRWNHSTHEITWALLKNVQSEYIFNFTTDVLSANTDYYTAATWDGTTDSNAVKLYVDGDVNVQATASQTETVVPTNNTRIGDDYYALDRHYEGKMDEVRISNITRSSAWVKATYYSNWDELASYGIAEYYSPEVILPSPFSATTSLQSNIQVELVPGALQAESSLSISEPFWGTYIELPSSFATQSSLQAKTGLDIAITSFIAQANLQSNIQIELISPVFASQSELSISEIWFGIITTLPNPFSANASLQAKTQIEVVVSPLIATATLFSNLGIEVSAGILNATGAILATPIYPIILTGTKRIYLFTLTGAADGVVDIIIPISSFQSRIKSGDPTYLSVVIPGTDWSSAINARLNGELIVKMGYLLNNEIVLSEIISQVTMDGIRIDEGTSKQSITLDGYKTEVFIHKEVDLKNPIYMNLDAGKLRYRCTPDLYLKPGDTANINNDSFIVDTISFSVSAELETYEIAEA